MARQLLRDTCALAAAIIDGEHDEDLDSIAQAVQARKKRMFRPGTKVELVGTRNVALDGQIATVTKTNARTISIQLDDGRGYNVDSGLLRLVPNAPRESGLTRVERSELDGLR